MFSWLRTPPPETPGLVERSLERLLTALGRLDGQMLEALDRIEAMQTTLAGLRALSDENAESLRKLARSLGRTALRVEEIERKLEERQAAIVDRDHDDLFDAIDVLEHALSSVDRASHPELAAGLDGTLSRLGRQLTALGLERVTGRGAPPDGACMRVVGTEEADPPLEGRVIAVVRAAITQDGRVLREGEVITGRAPTRGSEATP